MSDDTEGRFDRFDGSPRASPPLPGNKPVLGVTIFMGRVFAANEDGIYFLNDAEWKRLEVEPVQP